MIERSTMPTISTTTADLAEGLPRGLTTGAVEALREALRLPTSAREFLLFLAGLTLLAGGLTMHVLLSAQLFQARVHLEDLNVQLSRVEEVNAEVIWEIAEAGRLEAVQVRALELGYLPAPERLYVVPTSVQPATATTAPTVVPLPVDTPVGAVDDAPTPFAARLAAWKGVLHTNWERATDWVRKLTGR